MLKFKSLAIVALVALSLSPSQIFSIDEKDSHAGGAEKPKADASGSHQENAFSQYDALKERIESLAKNAPSEAGQLQLLESIDGKPRKVKITPSKQQFQDGAATIQRVKWYREQMAQSCEASDKSSKMLGEFIDNCLVGSVIFDSIKSKADEEDKTTFELNAMEVKHCRDDLNAYFKAKKERVGAANWSKYAIDQEINDKLTKFYNWYGASIEGIESGSGSEPSEMVKEIGMVNPSSNLCLIEEKQPTAVGVAPQKPNPGPAQPSQNFTPPQVQNPQAQPQPQQPVPQQQPSQATTPPYQPPAQGYNPGNYGSYNNCKNGEGLGNRCAYDPSDYRPSYERDTFGSYLPLMGGYRGNGGGYVPPASSPSSPAYFPARQSPAPIQSGIAPAVFPQRALSLGFGFSSGYPYGYMPYGPYMGGYGGGMYSPIGYSPIGIGGGYVGGSPVIASSITPCSGLIGSCGGGCGGGLVTSCGGGCGGGLITPISTCGGNGMINPLLNPMGMNPNRSFNPRMPYNPWNPYNPFLNNYNNWNTYTPWRTTIPRVTGSPFQPVTPVNPGNPRNPGIPVTPGNPGYPNYPGNPIYNTVTNPVSTNPVRVVVPRTN